MRRHNPSLHQVEPLSPLSVGNGGFAFTAGVTRQQTFPEEYVGGIPLCTQLWRGWDWPMTATTAARFGEPHLAVDALLMEAPRNRYLRHGHNYQENIFRSTCRGTGES